MKKLSDKSSKSIEIEKVEVEGSVQRPLPIELRIDDKGFIYSKHRRTDKLPLNDEEFAQFCQMIGCIALMEMRDATRVLH